MISLDYGSFNASSEASCIKLWSLCSSTAFLLQDLLQLCSCCGISYNHFPTAVSSKTTFRLQYIVQLYSFYNNFFNCIPATAFTPPAYFRNILQNSIPAAVSSARACLLQYLPKSHFCCNSSLWQLHSCCSIYYSKIPNAVFSTQFHSCYSADNEWIPGVSSITTFLLKYLPHLHSCHGISTPEFLLQYPPQLCSWYISISALLQQYFPLLNFYYGIYHLGAVLLQYNYNYICFPALSSTTAFLLKYL